MLYRMTNDVKPPRAHVEYDSRRRPKLIETGKSITIELEDAAAEFIHERAIAGVGPRIERVSAASPPKEATSPDEGQQARPKPPRKAT